MADPIIGKISVGDGATFTPSVDSDGKLSWTNNKNLPNPATVDIAQAIIDAGTLAPTASPTFTGTVTAADISASGDLAVTGTITGNVTGNLTGNADTATNATNDGNGNEISATYLPFAGGTMTGSIIYDGSGIYALPIKQKYDSAAIRFFGGTDDSSSYLWLFGKNSAGAGRFDLTANDGTNSTLLRGFPNGTLQWGGKNIVVADAGNGYISFTNGIQMCWGAGNGSSSGAGFSFPKAFPDTSGLRVLASALNSNAVTYVNDVTATGFKMYNANSSWCFYFAVRGV